MSYGDATSGLGAALNVVGGLTRAGGQQLSGRVAAAGEQGVGTLRSGEPFLEGLALASVRLDQDAAPDLRDRHRRDKQVIVSQNLRLKAGANFLQCVHEPCHLVGPDPTVQRKPIEPGHFRSHPGKRIQRHRITRG